MIVRAAVLVLALAAAAATAQSLPELGDASASVLPPQMERKIGEQAMRDIRARDPKFVDDPELDDYINSLGRRLVAASPEARQDFEFFLVQDRSINAFAMPGGFVGVHTGLLLAAQTESEVAGVLGHEIAHVTQRHIARMFGRQQQLSVASMAALVVAMIAARSQPEAAHGIAAAVGAGMVQAQLDYSRDFEREADRVGFQILQGAGFDVNGMASFFERLQQAGRLYENNAPAYLRTHPLTGERMADMQNRVQGARYRQAPDSTEFQMVRSKLRAEEGTPREALAHFQQVVQERRYASEAAARYGLASALARSRDYKAADAEVEQVRRIAGRHPMVEMLAARIRGALGDRAGARDLLRAALQRNPNQHALSYAYVQSLQGLEQHAQALQVLADMLRSTPRDARLYRLQAQSHAASGRRLLQHQSLAEAYYLQGTLPAAIEQLQIAQRANDGNFYQLSAVEARLREFQRLHAEETGRKPLPR